MQPITVSQTVIYMSRRMGYFKNLPMELVECIKDNDYHPEALKYISNYPVRGDVYEVRKRNHTPNGLGYLLMEIENPIMSNGKEPSFSAKRFKPVDSTDDLIKELTEEYEYEN